MCQKEFPTTPQCVFLTNEDTADILYRKYVCYLLLAFFGFVDLELSVDPARSSFFSETLPLMGELSDPNLTVLPSHPGIKCGTRSPFCDIDS